jgi:hypothetical protein
MMKLFTTNDMTKADIDDPQGMIVILNGLGKKE